MLHVVFIKKIKFSLKLRHFGGHFEFLSVSDVKRHCRSKILSDLESANNLATETTRLTFILTKKAKFAQPYYWQANTFGYRA